MTQERKDIELLLNLAEEILRIEEDLDLDRIDKFFERNQKELKALAKRYGRDELAERISEQSLKNIWKKIAPKLTKIMFSAFVSSDDK